MLAVAVSLVKRHTADRRAVSGVSSTVLTMRVRTRRVAMLEKVGPQQALVNFFPTERNLDKGFGRIFW